MSTRNECLCRHRNCLENFLKSFFIFSLPNTCREHVLLCAVCGLFRVCCSVLPASTKTCASLPVWHQQHDKLCHLPCDPHCCVLSLRVEALWGRGCLLARAESSVGTYWKDSICRLLLVFFFSERIGERTECDDL